MALMTTRSSVFGALLDEKNFRAGRNLSADSRSISSFGEDWTFGGDFSVAAGREENFAKTAKQSRLAR